MTRSAAAEPASGPLCPSAADDLVVQIDGVSLHYRIALDPRVSLKEYVLCFRRRRTIDHLALDQVDLVLGRGQALGIIGANGAGKSTLLKVLARVLHPTVGRVRIRGRVGAILDLIGAFHLELTGRENVFLNGILLGLTRREVARRLGGIIEFAGIDGFIDAPLRTYSAGMILRLAFSVATSVDADILLIDEALGVGDASFQRKCAARLEEYRRRGVSFVIVSHDVARLPTLCDRVLWLDRGRVRALGPAAEIVRAYLEAQTG
jgi:ABC-type polysaccharide/polyol phosphate transport system ATPase subunit